MAKVSTILKARSDVAECLEQYISACEDHIKYLRDRNDERIDEIKDENHDLSAHEIQSLIYDDWRIQSNFSDIEQEQENIKVAEDLLSCI